MANLRDIRNRIDSVENTQQVTRAMKMVAAAKLRRAQERIFTARPYAFKIREIITHLKRELDPGAHPLFQTAEEVESVLLVVVTADRGLAGAFNANVIRKAEDTLEGPYRDLYEAGKVRLLCIGRKGHEYFKRRDIEIVGDYRGFFEELKLETTRDLVDRINDGFLEGDWDEVKVVYNEFKNTISQNRIVEPFLPIPKDRFLTPVMEDEDELGDLDTADDAFAVEYIFEPDAKGILKVLVPRYLYYQLWRIVLESNAAEQGARMVAMDNATSNADDLLRDLRLDYNRARQSAITTEIIEITSGAEAMEQG